MRNFFSFIIILIIFFHSTERMLKADNYPIFLLDNCIKQEREEKLLNSTLLIGLGLTGIGLSASMEKKDKESCLYIGGTFIGAGILQLIMPTKSSKIVEKVKRGEISVDEGFYQIYKYGRKKRKIEGWTTIGVGAIFTGITVAVLTSDNVEVSLFNKKVNKSQSASFLIPFSLTFLARGIVWLCTNSYYEIAYDNYKAYKKSKETAKINFLYNKNQYGMLITSKF